MYSLRDLRPLAATADQAADWVVAQAADRKGGFVVTCNVDHYRRLQKDPRFQALYSQSSLQTIDGAPLVWLLRLLGVAVDRVTGADLPYAILDRHPGTRFLIIGGSSETNAAAVSRLGALGMRISGMDVGPVADFDNLAREVATEVGRVNADLVLVCLGSPKQEYVAEALARQGVYSLCVGAFVDFAAQRVSRAPTWMRAAGLEWVWRLSQDPKRLAYRYAACAIELPGLAARELWQRYLIRRGH